MRWMPFFKSRSSKYGFFSGCVGFAAGVGGSAAVALKMASYCSSAVTNFIHEIGQNVSISDVNAVVHIGELKINITLDDIDVLFPEGWLNLINSTKELSSYCFVAPFAIGLCLSSVFALSLANTVALAVRAKDLDAALPRDHVAPLVEIANGEDDDSILMYQGFS